MKKRILSICAILLVLLSVSVLGAFEVLAADNTKEKQKTDISGDINGDGKLSVADCVYIELILSGKKSPTEKADINFDTVITEEDAEILAEYIAKNRQSLPKKQTGGDIDTPIIF